MTRISIIPAVSISTIIISAFSSIHSFRSIYTTAIISTIISVTFWSAHIFTMVPVSMLWTVAISSILISSPIISTSIISILGTTTAISKIHFVNISSSYIQIFTFFSVHQHLSFFQIT
eukprot:NODE_153_length_15389_cov_1.201439.p18 type:complete len:118 gc:universal NODE_153_length_15389_cov_1.201439:593-946(+)